jgi:predicted HTH domain antitoxin
MQLTIDDAIIHALKAPEPKVESVLRQALAVSLYAQRMLPLGPARQLAGLTRWEFDELLARENVARNYTLADLREDAALAKEDLLPAPPHSNP